MHNAVSRTLLLILIGTLLLPVASSRTAASPPHDLVYDSAHETALAQGRPALSGDAYTFSTTHFVIHYTYVGIDAVPAGDMNGNDVPDWVEEVGRALETIWRVEIDRLGWPAPLADRGEGGDERFDVYMQELFSKGLGGYVSPDGGYVGDNPNTDRTEQQAAYGFMVLDNDYIDPSPPAGLLVWPPADWMRIIAAHEFNHMLQISINGAHPMRWFYEATSNWMETQVFPDLPDNLVSAGAVFKSPDTCMLRYGGVNRVESGLHWYGMWTFDQVLSETYGADMILDIWYRMADSPGFTPFDEAFAARGTTFTEEMRRFALSILLRDFANGEAYPVTRLESELNSPGEISPANGVQRYAMEYIGLNLTGTQRVTLDSDDVGIEGIVVGMRGESADVFPAGRAITVDFSAYDHAYLVIVNQTRPPNEAGCATSRYRVTVSDPASDAAGEDAADTLRGVDYTVRAPYFVPPAVEATSDPEDIPFLSPFAQTEYNINDEIKQVDLPFDPITPRGAPDGFELDSVYGVDAGELGEEFVALNAPSGGVVAQMLYYNDAGDLIRITQSPTIYVTIGEWLAVNRLEFAAGTEIWTAGTVDTAVVRKGDGYLVAFIVRERFLTIDGDASRDAMLDMAQRFASSFGAGLPDPRWPGQDTFGKAYN